MRAAPPQGSVSEEAAPAQEVGRILLHIHTLVNPTHISQALGVSAQLPLTTCMPYLRRSRLAMQAYYEISPPPCSHDLPFPSQENEHSIKTRGDFSRATVL